MHFAAFAAVLLLTSVIVLILLTNSLPTRSGRIDLAKATKADVRAGCLLIVRLLLGENAHLALEFWDSAIVFFSYTRLHPSPCHL